MPGSWRGQGCMHCAGRTSNSDDEGSMSRGKFLVAFAEGHWRIGYNEQWYGKYPDRDSAQGATMAIVQAHGEVPTRVIVREIDGTEELVWPCKASKARKPS